MIDREIRQVSSVIRDLQLVSKETYKGTVEKDLLSF